jgi:hypothetical protein
MHFPLLHSSKQKKKKNSRGHTFSLQHTTRVEVDMSAPPSGSVASAARVPQMSLTADSPATIIVARHGLRVDFVDREWGRTAERPHDSPMTQSGRVMGWRMGVHLWARLREMHQAPSSPDVAAVLRFEERVAEVAALLDRVVVLASPLMRAVDTAAHVCQGLEDAAAQELAAYAAASAVSPSGFAPWDHRPRLPARLVHPAGHPMVLGEMREGGHAHGRRIPIHVEPAMTETTYWMCRDMCKKYRRSHLESAEVPQPIVLPAEELKRVVSDRIVVTTVGQEDAHRGGLESRAVLCPVHYEFDPRRGTVVEALQPAERFTRAWQHLLAPCHYAAHARSQPVPAAGHTATTPLPPSPYRDKIVLLLGHGQTVAGMAQTLPRVLKSDFAVPAVHVPKVTPVEAPLAGFAMFHRRAMKGGSAGAHTYETVVDAFSEEHLGVQE